MPISKGSTTSYRFHSRRMKGHFWQALLQRACLKPIRSDLSVEWKSLLSNAFKPVLKPESVKSIRMRKSSLTMRGYSTVWISENPLPPLCTTMVWTSSSMLQAELEMVFSMKHKNVSKRAKKFGSSASIKISPWNSGMMLP